MLIIHLVYIVMSIDQGNQDTVDHNVLYSNLLYVFTYWE